MIAEREKRGRPLDEFGTEEKWMKALNDDLRRFMPFLLEKCRIHFHGRVLEIGAGGGWLSAEVSKLPKVVEVVTTDYSPRMLKEEAPRVFQLLKAHSSKITRMPGDFHKLDFPDNYFDFVVSSAALQHAVNIVQALREVKRILKPGGVYVAIREPVWPLMRLNAEKRKAAGPGGLGSNYYSLAHYKESFKQAALPVEIKRVTLSSGFKYYVDSVVNGLTHARYAFIARKRGRPEPASRAKKAMDISRR
jgi:ubiquinone/menaquinone biosynthesis C-methylase UbiE